MQISAKAQPRLSSGTIIVVFCDESCLTQNMKRWRTTAPLFRDQIKLILIAAKNNLAFIRWHHNTAQIATKTMARLSDMTDVASNTTVPSRSSSQEHGLVSPVPSCGKLPLSLASSHSQQDASRSPIRDRSNRKNSLGSSSATDVVHRRLFRRRHDSLRARLELLVFTRDEKD
jgi:hypothetical protein